MQVSQILSELDIDLWMIWVRETSQLRDPALDLLLDGDLVWQSALLYLQDGSRVAVVGNFDADGLKEKQLFDRIEPYTKSIKETLIDELEAVDPSQIALNYSKNDVAADGLTLGMYRSLKEMLGGTDFERRFVSAEDIIARLRGRKTKTELDRIRKAVQITEKIYSVIREEVKPGQTELEIYQRFHDLTKNSEVGPAWAPDHCPAVDAGPSKQFGHAGPTDNKTKEGHLLHFDFGVKYFGYCSDIQRMFFFGKKEDVPDQITSAFNTVRDAIQTAADKIKPGMKGYEVDAIARNYVVDHGYDEYQHALGHQVGQHAHDGGVLLGPLWERYGDIPKGEVEAGNVFTLELYVTTEDYGQVSLEEDIVITKNGCEFLSIPQRQLICIHD
jgi:Xaa-Pro aminopeptidase